METAAQDQEHSRRKRRYRTAEEKRRIVEDTLSPDVSVAIVARRHGVNANQVFHWRKLVRSRHARFVVRSTEGQLRSAIVAGHG